MKEKGTIEEELKYQEELFCVSLAMCGDCEYIWRVTKTYLKLRDERPEVFDLINNSLKGREYSPK